VSRAIAERVWQTFLADWVELFGDPERRAAAIRELEPLAHPRLETATATEAGGLGIDPVAYGIEGYFSVVEEWISPFSHYLPTLERAIELDDGRVLCLARVHARTRTGDAAVESVMDSLWEFEEDRVRRISVFMSREQALELAGLA
jgi:hypothetical protein